ncbi:MAG: DNA-processing protein DprA [Chitinophagaceae bacterium]|nr:DNA-processing protein DprA [Chitinophagaceae bacterium]
MPYWLVAGQDLSWRKTKPGKANDRTGRPAHRFCSGTKPDKQNFPKRNRIVAGICDALIVVESAAKKVAHAIYTAELANKL